MEGQAYALSIPQLPGACWGHVTSCYPWNVGAGEAQHFMARPLKTSPLSLHRPPEPYSKDQQMFSREARGQTF